MTMEIMLTEREGEHYADSRMIAGALAVEHHNAIALIRKYELDMGILLFETEVLNRPGQPRKYALLTERQSLYLLTLVQNTERAREAKLKLVDAFLSLRAAKNPASLSRLEILNMAIQSETERLRLEAENQENRIAHRERCGSVRCVGNMDRSGTEQKLNSGED